MPTIRDVAKRAAVSVGTVSRVLSRNETVKQPLRERVLIAVDALGYKPNLAARALRTNRVNIIGLVVPDITNPFFAQMAKCIETEAAKRNHSVILANSHDDTKTERRQITALLDHRPRGVIVVAASDTGKLDYDTDVTIISLDRRFENFPLVSTDHSDGSRKIANHLYKLGHRHIVYIAGSQSTKVGRARKNGFVAQIKRLNQKHDPIHLLVLEGSFNYESGEELGRKVLAAKHPWKPTAIAAASDQLAIGVLRAAQDLKLKIPTDLSVAGFDDIELAALVVPRLTTIRQPTELLAQSALELVFLKDGKITEKKLKGELVVRDSTAKPKSR